MTKPGADLMREEKKMRSILLVTILSLITSAYAQTSSAASRIQNPDQKVLTYHDYRNGKTIGGSGGRELTFWLEVNPKLPPYKFRLIPEAVVGDPSGTGDSPHRVGQIEISTGTPSHLVQKIDVYTRADASFFTAYFKAIDVNFDGFLDIAVTDQFGIKWGREKYWLFDKRTGRYITNQLTKELYRITHNGIELHPETREIEVGHFPEQIPRPGKVSERYKLINGRLILIGTEEIRSTGRGLRIFIRKRIKGKMRTIEIKEIEAAGKTPHSIVKKILNLA